MRSATPLHIAQMRRAVCQLSRDSCRCHGNEFRITGVFFIVTEGSAITVKFVLFSRELRVIFVTARRYAVARCPSVCQFVRPSVTLVHCIHMAEDIVKLLSQPRSPIVLVF